jgi:hypothetical protein
MGVLASPETSPAARSHQSKPTPVSVRMRGGVGSTGRARVAADLGIPAQVHLALSFGFVFEMNFRICLMLIKSIFVFALSRSTV